MASRLPRCLALSHGKIAHWAKNSGILQRRSFSAPPSPPGGGKPEVSKHTNFYREFGRPMSKVFLMAFFSYQVFYWIWARMEKDEEKREKDKELSGLLVEVERLRGAG